MSPKPELILRYMALADMPAVMTIDRLSFDIPWSESAYHYEVAESMHSHMVTLEYRVLGAVSRWRRWLPGANGGQIERRIVGYGGLWQIVSEAHISTIAVHPSARGRGWGEILLAGMIRRSIMLDAQEVVLEVRVSNTRAQNLYYKYEFNQVDVKKRYYRNNDEDAYDMRLNIANPEIRQRFDERFAALMARYAFLDAYTAAQPPVKVPRE